MASDACIEGVKCFSCLYVVHIFKRKAKKGRLSTKFTIGVASGEERIDQLVTDIYPSEKPTIRSLTMTNPGESQRPTSCIFAILASFFLLIYSQHTEVISETKLKFSILNR